MDCWIRAAHILEQQEVFLSLWYTLPESERHGALVAILENLECAAMVHANRYIFWANDELRQLHNEPIPVGQDWEPRRMTPRSRAILHEHSLSDHEEHYMCPMDGMLMEIHSWPIMWQGEPARVALAWPEMTRVWVDIAPKATVRTIGHACRERERVS